MSVENMPGVIKSDDSCHSPMTYETAECKALSDNLLVECNGTASEDESVPEVPSYSAQNPGECADRLMVESMLNHLARSPDASFKSQQVGDPDLDFLQKKEIANELLTHSPAQFLSKFGQFLQEDHLDYFTSRNESSECYEVDFHVKRLRRYHCKAKNEVDVRNRRYEALKKLVAEGVYFSEEEMKKRNPLMYEQMIGQFLTPEEKEELRRKEERKKNDRSYVVHLMGQIEDHYVNCLKKQQMDDEYEEMDTSDEEDLVEEEGENQEATTTDEDIEEFDTESETEDTESKKETPCKVVSRKRKLPWEEKQLLREEFITNMYENFLAGKDTDFDYSNVDSNPEYENVVLKGQDEEEKYFDSETPELVRSGNVSGAESDAIADNEEEEDELDKFMKSLKPD